MENNPGTNLQYLVNIYCYHNNLLGKNFMIMTFEQTINLKNKNLKRNSYLKCWLVITIFIREM